MKSLELCSLLLGGASFILATPLAPPLGGSTCPYQIQEGDDCDSIALRYSTTVEALHALNTELSDDCTAIDQSIIVPCHAHPNGPNLEDEKVEDLGQASSALPQDSVNDPPAPVDEGDPATTVPGQVPGQASSVASRMSGSTPPAADETAGKMDTNLQVPGQPLPDNPLKGAIDPLPAISETVKVTSTPGHVPDQVSSVASQVSSSTPVAPNKTAGTISTPGQASSHPLPFPLSGSTDALTAANETVVATKTPGQVPDQALSVPLKGSADALPTTNETVAVANKPVQAPDEPLSVTPQSPINASPATGETVATTAPSAQGLGQPLPVASQGSSITPPAANEAGGPTTTPGQVPDQISNTPQGPISNTTSATNETMPTIAKSAQASDQASMVRSQGFVSMGNGSAATSGAMAATTEPQVPDQLSATKESNISSKNSSFPVNDTMAMKVTSAKIPGRASLVPSRGFISKPAPTGTDAPSAKGPACTDMPAADAPASGNALSAEVRLKYEQSVQRLFGNDTNMVNDNLLSPSGDQLSDAIGFFCSPQADDEPPAALSPSSAHFVSVLVSLNVRLHLDGSLGICDATCSPSRVSDPGHDDVLVQSAADSHADYVDIEASSSITFDQVGPVGSSSGTEDAEDDNTCI